MSITAPAAMTLQLTDLPPELLQTVLQFAGSDVRTLLNCERTCRALHEVVGNDKTWGQCVPNVHHQRDLIVTATGEVRWHTFKLKVGEDFDFMGCASDRMRSCISYCLRLVRKEQRATRNAFHDHDQHDEAVMDMEEWTELVDSVLIFHSDYIGLGDREDDIFSLRLDTMHVLSEIVQEAMLRLLSRANSMSCSMASCLKQYPILTCEHFCHKLVCEDFMPSGSLTDLLFVSEVAELLPESKRLAIIRILSRRAGIVRMSNDTYALVWGTIVRLILMLLQPACTELINCNLRGNEERRVTFPCPGRDPVYMIPPLSKTPICEDCGHSHFCEHTPVPKQIEDAAKDLGLVHRVYGFSDSFCVADSDIEMDYECQSESEDDMSIDSFDSDAARAAVDELRSED